MEEKKGYHGDTERTEFHGEIINRNRRPEKGIGFKPYPMDIAHAYSGFACINLSEAYP